VPRQEESLPAHCEVELDIFSGMPNPKWMLTETEADSFLKQLAELPRISARKLLGNLGYRGFNVTCAHGASTQVIRIQNGTVHISADVANVYANDENRELERWLLGTAKPHLKDELFKIVEREFSR
jgi:hypothetical protein